MLHRLCFTTARVAAQLRQVMERRGMLRKIEVSQKKAFFIHSVPRVTALDTTIRRAPQQHPRLAWSKVGHQVGAAHATARRWHAGAAAPCARRVQAQPVAPNGCIDAGTRKWRSRCSLVRPSFQIGSRLCARLGEDLLRPFFRPSHLAPSRLLV